MSKIVITIEDTDRGSVSVAWNNETGGYLHEDGTLAEQVALSVLSVLAAETGAKLPVVKIGEGAGN